MRLVPISMIAILASCNGGDRGGSAAPVPDPTCDDVARHFADYLSPRHEPDVWPMVHDDLARSCKGNDFSVEERRCWMQIDDAAAQQRCVDLRKRLGKPPVRYIKSEQDLRDERELQRDLDELPDEPDGS